jgi:hypothetical protein
VFLLAFPFRFGALASCVIRITPAGRNALTNAKTETSERSRWLLLALEAAGENGLTPVRLQKSLFVFGRRTKVPLKGFYDFQPYDYGPFDAQVYRDAEVLAAAGFIAIDEAHTLRKFRLTRLGQAQAADLATKMPKPSVDFMRAVVAWTQRLSFSALVRAIYESFPEMSANSVFRDPV